MTPRIGYRPARERRPADPVLTSGGTVVDLSTLGVRGLTLKLGIGFSLAVGAALACMPAMAQPEGDVAGQGQPEVVRPLVPIPAERLEQMVPKHPGYLGALAPENIARPRPAAPFDVTGTWFVDLSRASPTTCSARPTRSSCPGARGADRAAQGPGARRDLPRRDRPVLSAGHADADDPRVAARVHPAADRDLRDQGFNNSVRTIFLDGREHSRSRPRGAELQRRIDRPLGRRHAGRAHHLLRGRQPLHRPRHPDLRQVRADRADPAGQRRQDDGSRVHAGRPDDVAGRLALDQALQPRRTTPTSTRPTASCSTTPTCPAPTSAARPPSSAGRAKSRECRTMNRLVLAALPPRCSPPSPRWRITASRCSTSARS